ncbi:MAG: 23S rRNA (pseudouridine(1915)-N(3))-methyltransferase RlmH [candidate division Zixibacteria bacterium]|nr:23S rRNA (pseudouridine(1915)-N(3))-methyltransferase RlmH [candidate division Zixibacteria bacterium]
MLAIDIITVGKIKSPWVKEGVEYYRKLVGKYAELTLIHVKEADNARMKPEKAMFIEGENILDQLDDDAYSIALDVRGESLSSEQLSRLLENKKRDYSRIQFVIGGAYGLDIAVKADMDMELSLSRMTFTHELAEVILLEQLYRALSISAGSKYHK